MKIVVGLGSIDEYIKFAEAGADEFFCGYVPYSWSQKYGTVLPLNRREVLCYNVQLGAFSELEILSGMMKKYEKPVHLTFNSLYYIPEQYPEIAGIISQCMKIGFHSYIIADPALMVYLRENGINCEIHLSGECGEINSQMVASLGKLGLKRVIFHRKNSLEDMQSCIKFVNDKKINYKCDMKENIEEKYMFPDEYEAFILNELCHFSGAFCNSLHCDELTHLCRVPYELGNLHKKEETDAAQKDVAETDRIQGKEGKGLPLDEDGYLTGSTGCGLCALYRMKQVGITHLKLVGRGNYTDFMEKDIRQLRKALDILEKSDNELQYQREMKASLFPDGCSQNCYYR